MEDRKEILSRDEVEVVERLVVAKGRENRP